MTKPEALRRRRFQFSLRTLMIGVLTYGALWVLTVKWGANGMAREYALQSAFDFPSDHISIQKVSDGRVDVTGLVYDNAYPLDGLAISVRSPCPGVLQYSERLTIRGDTYDGYRRSETLLWCFGFRVPLYRLKWWETKSNTFNQIGDDEEVPNALEK